VGLSFVGEKNIVSHVCMCALDGTDKETMLAKAEDGRPLWQSLQFPDLHKALSPLPDPPAAAVSLTREQKSTLLRLQAEKELRTWVMQKKLPLETMCDMTELRKSLDFSNPKSKVTQTQFNLAMKRTPRSAAYNSEVVARLLTEVGLQYIRGDTKPEPVPAVPLHIPDFPSPKQHPGAGRQAQPAKPHESSSPAPKPVLSGHHANPAQPPSSSPSSSSPVPCVASSDKECQSPATGRLLAITAQKGALFHLVRVFDPAPPGTFRVQYLGHDPPRAKEKSKGPFLAKWQLAWNDPNDKRTPFVHSNSFPKRYKDARPCTELLSQDDVLCEVELDNTGVLTEHSQKRIFVALPTTAQAQARAEAHAREENSRPGRKKRKRKH
jgi:hypothetical protein